MDGGVFTVQDVFSSRHCTISRHPGEFSDIVYGMRKDLTNERDFERRSVRFDIKFKRFRSGCVTSDAVGDYQGRLP